MNWRIGVENQQVREFCTTHLQSAVEPANVLMQTALDAGADAVEVTTDCVRFRVGGEWRKADPISADSLPAVCALMLVHHGCAGPEGTVGTSQDGESRQIRVDPKALKLSLVIE